MRLLFCALPAYGHVYPLLPIAEAVAGAGHEVEFATTGPFVAMVAGLGYETHDVGPTIEAARAELVGSTHTSAMPRDENGRPDRSAAGRLFIDLLGRPTAADLGPLLHRRRPDLVVYESYDLGAAIAAAVAGIPAIDLGVSPRLSDVEHRAFAGERLDRVWAEHESVAPSFDVFTGDAYLDPFPDALQPAAFRSDPSRIRMRSVPFSDPTISLPAWVASTERPLVYLTLGTIVATGDVLRPAVDGLATLDADVLVALGSASGAELGPVPGNVHVEPFVDQAAVLARADLVVHHAGSGTILGALGHGTPQLLLPKGTDQFANADRMVAAGLAAMLEPRFATAEAVAVAATDALVHRRPALAATRQELAALPDPADVMDELIARFT